MPKFAANLTMLFNEAPFMERFALAAKAMRQIIIDHARRANAQKRGGGAVLTGVTIDALPGPASAPNLVALDEALDELAQLNERLAKIVELKFFAGLTVEEMADVLGITTRTVKRDWLLARAWLYRELSDR